MEIHYGVTLGYFFWSLLLGGIFALLYDVLRTVRRIRTASVLRIAAEDIVFLVIAGVMLASFAFDKNGGKLRWQGIAGALGGAGIYYFLFRNDMVWLLTKAYHIAVRTVLVLVRFVMLPVRLLFRLFRRPIGFVCWYCREAMRKTKTRVSVQVGRAKMNKKRVLAEKNEDIGIIK